MLSGASFRRHLILQPIVINGLNLFQFSLSSGPFFEGVSE